MTKTRKKPDVPTPTLSEFLKSYPGGIPGLADDLYGRVSRDTLYKFAKGERADEFPMRTANAIVAAFEGRRALGRAVTVEMLRRLWHIAKRRQEAAQGPTRAT